MLFDPKFSAFLHILLLLLAASVSPHPMLVFYHPMFSEAKEIVRSVKLQKFGHVSGHIHGEHRLHSCQVPRASRYIDTANHTHLLSAVPQLSSSLALPSLCPPIGTNQLSPRTAIPSLRDLLPIVLPNFSLVLQAALDAQVAGHSSSVTPRHWPFAYLLPISMTQKYAQTLLSVI